MGKGVGGVDRFVTLIRSARRKLFFDSIIGGNGQTHSPYSCRIIGKDRRAEFATLNIW